MSGPVLRINGWSEYCLTPPGSGSRYQGMQQPNGDRPLSNWLCPTGTNGDRFQVLILIPQSRSFDSR
ncbi:MAG: hypothetical protein ACFE0I_05395 [Elainellaceae cyanobacterium]